MNHNRLRVRLAKSDRPLVMAVLNVTPDSFYAASRVDPSSIDAVLARARSAIKNGADILDIGGESTRPGSSPISAQEEIDRVVPALEAIRKEFDVALSVDTSSPRLIAEALLHDIDLVNDVRALSKPGALECAAQAKIPVCLMHMQAAPDTMQANPSYSDVITEVYGFLRSRKDACLEAGMAESDILIDPGFGFGKKDEHNLTLLNQLSTFTTLGTLLVGLSRKSLIGRLLGRSEKQRLPASLALAAAAFDNGARIIRVHDVLETRDLLDMLWLLKHQREHDSVPSLQTL